MLGGLRPFSFDASRLFPSRDEHSRGEAILIFVKVAAGLDSGFFVARDNVGLDRHDRPP